MTPIKLGMEFINKLPIDLQECLKEAIVQISPHTKRIVIEVTKEDLYDLVLEHRGRLIALAEAVLGVPIRFFGVFYTRFGPTRLDDEMLREFILEKQP